MQNDSIKESDKEAAGSYSLTNSPYVGGNKMSSSLKDRLKRFRKYSSPISKPTSAVSVAARSIQFELPAHEYSKEEIENAMNEPISLINESSCSNSEEDIKIFIDKPHSLVKRNAFPTSMKNSNENVGSNPNEYAEICIQVTEPDENYSSFINNENDTDKSGTKLNENFCSVSFKSLDNGNNRPEPETKDNGSCCVIKETDNYIEPFMKVEEYNFPYSKEDIENCVDKKSLMEIFNNLQKDYAKNEEKFRKLKLVQNYHNKYSPDALKSLNKKWLTCTQSALRKLYSFMPEPGSITFESFLIFLQVDFNAVKYNPETDTFS